MNSPVLKRIVRQTGILRLWDVLAEELAPTDLQWLLVSVFRKRAQDIQEKDLIGNATSLTEASAVDARLLAAFDYHAFAAASSFEALDLSPVCPLGTTYRLGGIDQANILTTVRRTELLGDPTPVLALECARRLKREPAPVRLCCSHRLIRLQRFDFPGFTPHFRLFGMASAGRDTGSHAFEIQHVAEHVCVYLDLFRRLNTAGFSLINPLVEISDVRAVQSSLRQAGVPEEDVRREVRAHLMESGETFVARNSIPNAEHPILKIYEERLVPAIRSVHPEAEFRFRSDRLEGLGFYSGACFRILPQAPDGQRYPIVDGGMTCWTARLMQDRKQRLMTSGIGSEFVCKRYRT